MTTLAELKVLPDIELVTALQRDSMLNRARKEFSAACARLEQAGAQRQPFGPIERRRMEFEAVIKIAAILGVEGLEL